MTIFAGHVIDGGCVSFTVTLNEHVAVLPEESVAVHVTVLAPFGKTDPDGGLHTTDETRQLSEAVAVKLATAEDKPGAAGRLMFAGHVMDGGCVSFTVTVNEQVAVLPDPSVAVQLTLVTPFGKVDPDGGVHTVDETEQLSDAFA